MRHAQLSGLLMISAATSLLYSANARAQICACNSFGNDLLVYGTITTNAASLSNTGSVAPLKISHYLNVNADGIDVTGDLTYGVNATGASAGVYGTSGSAGGYGVYAENTSATGGNSVALGAKTDNPNGIGVWAWSTSGNAVQAWNTRTDLNAAVISATSGDQTNGLAYWGKGGIEITGQAYKTGGGSWQVLSDQRVKQDVKDFRQGLAEILRVRPVSYKYNGLGGSADDGKEYVGVIAQELEKIAPRMVTTRKAKLHAEDGQEMDIKEVDPSDFTYLLINAVQEQQKTIDRQEERIAQLEAGRRPVAMGMSMNGLGFGVAGLAVAGAFVVSRRKREEKDSAK